MLEARIQAEIVQYLQLQHIYFHSVPNEAAGRSQVMQGQLVAMGLRKGVADLIVWWPRSDQTLVLGYVEVKNEKGKQSPEQKRFEQRCKEACIPYVLVHSLDDVKAYMQLEGYGKS